MPGSKSKVRLIAVNTESKDKQEGVPGGGATAVPGGEQDDLHQTIDCHSITWQRIRSNDCSILSVCMAPININKQGQLVEELQDEDGKVVGIEYEASNK